jgi:hypothetical protein
MFFKKLKMRQQLLFICFVLLYSNLSGQSIEDLNKQALEINNKREPKSLKYY